jgi:hypothetical protein
MKIKSWACAVACASVVGAASAVVPGTANTFQDGTTQGWTSGPVTPAPPVAVLSGGPGGSGDGYLWLTSTGVSGPGGKLVAISGTDWTGNYTAAGITAISMDLDNLGSTTLSMRLYFAGTGGTAVTTSAVNLPVGSGWTHATFDISPGALTGAGAATMASVSEMRLFHGTDPTFPGANIAASLGVDNITAVAAAVPEPAAWLLWAAGLGAFALRRRTPATA